MNLKKKKKLAASSTGKKKNGNSKIGAMNCVYTCKKK